MEWVRLHHFRVNYSNPFFFVKGFYFRLCIDCINFLRPYHADPTSKAEDHIKTSGDVLHGRLVQSDING